MLPHENAEICSATGLNIVRSASATIYRVARPTYGPLNPPVRPHLASMTPHKWSRWDTPGRTIYGGTSAEGAFIEVIEYIRPDPPDTPLSELFDDVAVGDAPTFADQVARELQGCGGMKYRSISRGWRDERKLYELQLPADGWFVDVTGANSIAALDLACPQILRRFDIKQLALAHLTNPEPESRRLTTALAAFLREHVVLDDGSVPHGVIYPSKWGSTVQNVAMWMRRTDDGTGEDPIGVAQEHTIGIGHPALVAAARLRGMTIY